MQWGVGGDQSCGNDTRKVDQLYISCGRAPIGGVSESRPYYWVIGQPTQKVAQKGHFSFLASTRLVQWSLEKERFMMSVGRRLFPSSFVLLGEIGADCLTGYRDSQPDRHRQADMEEDVD